MCTALDYQGHCHYFGRNLDYHQTFGEEIVITPPSFPLPFRLREAFPRHFAFLGIATVIDGYPLYFDGVNERGIAIAGLNFVGTAHYASPAPEQENIAPYELIPYVLGSFSSVEEVRALLPRLNLVALPFREDLPLSELHWMISDKKECVVLEATMEGIRLYDNPIGVLTNNPPFPYHREHLREYLNLSPKAPTGGFSPDLSLHPFTKGLGAYGLPGDLSSPSRFVRAAFGRWNATQYEGDEESLAQFFHILNSVAQIDGCVREAEERERTQYTSCYQTEKGIGYFRTYENSQIRALRLLAEELEGTALIRYPLYISSEISWLNDVSD